MPKKDETTGWELCEGFFIFSVLNKEEPDTFIAIMIMMLEGSVNGTVSRTNLERFIKADSRLNNAIKRKFRSVESFLQRSIAYLKNGKRVGVSGDSIAMTRLLKREVRNRTGK